MLRQVKTHEGTVEGIAAQDPAITIFRGIPYAEPPVGNLRWRAPRPPKIRENMLHAHDFAPSALQPVSGPETFYGNEWGLDPAATMSEDCLYLNIWTPALRGSDDSAAVQATEPLPVMVWIHGGAYQVGTPAEKEFEGSQLARQGVIVVSIAYRLNVFGFFAHKALDSEAQECASGEPSANFGLLDQRAGIQWVRDNIAAFGGNPENITIFGQSAGAASVLAQVCSGMNTGLFSKVIMQSGAGLGMFNKTIWSLEQSQRTGELFLDYVHAENLEQARAINGSVLLQAACEFPASPYSLNQDEWAMPGNWAPCIDGRFLTEQFAASLGSGRAQPVAAIFGNTSNEFLAETEDGARVELGSLGNEALLQQWLTGMPSQPYCYRFDVALPGDDSGAFHSSDLWFSFGTLGACWRPFTGEYFDVSQRMVRYWTNFAKTSHPNQGDNKAIALPQWEPASEQQEVLHIGLNTYMQQGF